MCDYFRWTPLSLLLFFFRCLRFPRFVCVCVCICVLFLVAFVFAHCSLLFLRIVTKFEYLFLFCTLQMDFFPQIFDAFFCASPSAFFIFLCVSLCSPRLWYRYDVFYCHNKTKATPPPAPCATPPPHRPFRNGSRRHCKFSVAFFSTISLAALFFSPPVFAEGHYRNSVIPIRFLYFFRVRGRAFL